MYDRILVPTDGSDGSDRATEEAIELARAFDAEVHALYVVDPSAAPGEATGAGVLEALSAVGEESTGAVVDRARAAGVDVVDPVVETGSPFRTIADYAAENDVDLVVMGTHGRSGIERYLLGSVTEKVVRTATVPVLTIRAEGDESED